MTILSKVEWYLRQSGEAPSRFGRNVCKDPRLVFDLRLGRKVSPTLQTRILAHIATGTKHDHIPREAVKCK